VDLAAQRSQFRTGVVLDVAVVVDGPLDGLDDVDVWNDTRRHRGEARPHFGITGQLFFQFAGGALTRRHTKQVAGIEGVPRTRRAFDGVGIVDVGHRHVAAFFVHRPVLFDQPQRPGNRGGIAPRTPGEHAPAGGLVDAPVRDQSEGRLEAEGLDGVVERFFGWCRVHHVFRDPAPVAGAALPAMGG